MKYVITADFNGAPYYWMPSIDPKTSLWFSDLNEGWRIPSYHHLQQRIQLDLPSKLNFVDGVKTPDTPSNIRILDVGIE